MMVIFSSPSPRLGEQRGYILVLTVVMLALLTVAASFIAQRVALAQAQAQGEVDVSNAEFRLQSARARVIWTLATAERAGGGLLANGELLKCDGRWYDLGDGVAVSIQDSRGLLNIAKQPRDVMERFLATFGLDPSQARHLIDTLGDYQDGDVLSRLQGAEAPQYNAKGLRPPRDAPIVVPDELTTVWGWSETPALWEPDGLLDHVYIWSESYINPNTATWRTLAAVFALSESDAKRLVVARRAGTVDLYQMFAGGEDPFLSKFSPVESRAFVLRLAVRGRAAMYREFLVLTPQSASGPWRSSYVDEYVAMREQLPEDLPAFPRSVKGPGMQGAAPPSENSPLNQDIRLPF